MAPTVIAESATLNAQKCVRAPVHVDEVDDVAGDGAVDQVADRAAEDQRQAEARQPLVEAELRRVGRDGDERQRRDRRSSRAVLNGKSARVQQAERRAGVADVRQVEEARDERAGSRASGSAAGRSPSSADRRRR